MNGVNARQGIAAYCWPRGFLFRPGSEDIFNFLSKFLQERISTSYSLFPPPEVKYFQQSPYPSRREPSSPHTQSPGNGMHGSSASGQVWTASYIEATGDLPADLLSNIAAEQRAKVVYEYLHRQIADRYVRQMIDFLRNREEALNTMFRECFQKVQGTGSTQDWGVDKDARLFFNLFTVMVLYISFSSQARPSLPAFP
ncbi:manganese catalase family protein [Moorellaceae bacterium AZ2]